MTTAQTTAPIQNIIAATRSAQHLTQREFSKHLGVTYQMVAFYENGQHEPDKDSVARWIESNTPWVRHLGFEVFLSQFGDFVQLILRPRARRYALTTKGRAVVMQPANPE